MCLPILVGLFACIFQVGATVTAEAFVVVEARHQAWSSRWESTGADPFNFEAPNDVEGSAHKAVKVSAIFRGFPEPRSRHTVLAGAWDHRQVNLDRQPNWDLDVKLAAEGKVSQVQNATDDLMLFRMFGPDAVQNVVQTYFQNQLTGPFGKLGNIQGFLNEFLGRKDQRQAKNAELFKQKRDTWKQDIQGSKDSVDAITKKIDENKARAEEIDKLLKDDDKADEADKMKEEKRKDLEDERKKITEETNPKLTKDLEAAKKKYNGMNDALEKVDGYRGPAQ